MSFLQPKEWPPKKQSLYSALTTASLHCIRRPSQCTGKKYKGIKIGKEQGKLSLSTDNIIVNVENY